mmetsp:Transcript_58448/g.139047  ORF Transcript_58448/g.139047 Transcript_58448/m.139047 type:complete len:588 (-) Transcript_58448:75-1838(-)
MRTVKAITRKTGFRICSRTAFCFYLTVLFFVYSMAMVYLHHSTHHGEVDSLQRELASLRSVANVSAPADEHPRVASLKSQVAAHEVEIIKLQDAASAKAGASALPHPVAEALPLPVAEAAAAEKSADGAAAGGGGGGGVDKERRNTVKAAMLHSWEGYKKFAWGTDELLPQAKTGHNWLGQGGTIIDAMSTLAVMGEMAEFRKAADWAKKDFQLAGKGDVSFFETTIRVLGGLLSAYETTCDLPEGCDQGLLDKAKEVGDRLLKAFDTPTGLPFATINLSNGRGHTPGWTGGAAILAEVASVQLEFGALSRHTKDPKYDAAAIKVFKILEGLHRPDGLMPLYIDIHKAKFTTGHVSLGAMGDSAFEYLIKVWIQRGGKDAWLKKMYDEASEGILSKLLQTSSAGHVYVAESRGSSLSHKMDHLACFTGGMLVLGSKTATNPEQHMKAAKGIGETCFQMYAKMASGIAPENVDLSSGELRAGASYNIQRPESVETFFYLWRATKDPIWREHGWAAFQAWEKHCRIPTGGYVGVRDVRKENPPKDDTQQTFWLAETLKYLYLLFSEDELIPLDKYVFNTEAHPLKIWKD